MSGEAFFQEFINIYRIQIFVCLIILFFLTSAPQAQIWCCPYSIPSSPSNSITWCAVVHELRAVRDDGQMDGRKSKVSFIFLSSFALSAKAVSIIATSCLLPPLNIPKPPSIKRNFTGRPLVFQIANTKMTLKSCFFKQPSSENGIFVHYF